MSAGIAGVLYPLPERKAFHVVRTLVHQPPPRPPAAGCLLTEPVCATPCQGGKRSTASHSALPTVKDPHVRPGNSGRGAEAERGAGVSKC
ncbi:hypothetical protein E2C01_081413 [Portunus trituberculatus]|uniref:Uncharacterized protein n=1 Tax=Portunus trituberculatus TaxID=210409 RepID=A0A5B7J127_PORTR|nr:hypothetical protein [Portunus trituberculatus]